MSNLPTFDSDFDQTTPLSDRSKGLLLAVSSSIFIGASFIVKKKGLRAAGATGIRAGKVAFIQRVLLSSRFCQQHRHFHRQWRLLIPDKALMVGWNVDHGCW